SLSPSLAQRATIVEVLRILVSIGLTETMHFRTWSDAEGDANAFVNENGRAGNSSALTIRGGQQSPHASYRSRTAAPLSVSSTLRRCRRAIARRRHPTNT